MFNKNIYEIIEQDHVGEFIIYRLKIKDMLRKAHEVWVRRQLPDGSENKPIPSLYQHSLSFEDAKIIFKTIRKTMKFMIAIQSGYNSEDIEA